MRLGCDLLAASILMTRPLHLAGLFATALTLTGPWGVAQDLVADINATANTSSSSPQDFAAFGPNALFLTMGGGCHGCSMSRMTMLEGVQTMIVEAIPAIERVRDLTDHSSGENPYYH